MENSRIEILLVDDNDDDIFMIEEAFRDEDLVHISKAVQDGRAALAYLRNEGEYRDASRPSLVLLDINMPRTNGLEVLMMIKEDERLKTLPVVMLTTSDRTEDVETAYRYGASSFITKPLDFTSFQQAAREFSSYWARLATVP